MLRVGLTGGIASGKSHVRRRLDAAGLATLDLDDVAHRVIAPGGPAYADVVRAFGARILAADGSVDRKVLGALVFADPAARAQLNALVHPRVRDEEERAAASLDPGPGSILVTDAALLVEAGVHLRFDRLVTVYCPPEEQERRLGARDGLDAEAVRARLRAQMSGEEKRLFAHYTIDASGSVAETDVLVDALVPELRAVAGRRREPVPLPPEHIQRRLLGGPREASLLAALANAERLEMDALAAVLAPGHTGPWYRAGGLDGDPAGAASALVPLVWWSLTRRGPDPPWLAGAAASVARLIHREPAALSGAVLFALALEEAVRHGGPPGLAARLAEWTSDATRWGGAPPPAEVVEAVRSAAAGQGEPGTLAGALLG
jgi:dephospho-CoA kinase